MSIAKITALIICSIGIVVSLFAFIRILVDEIHDGQPKDKVDFDKFIDELCGKESK